MRQSPLFSNSPFSKVKPTPKSIRLGTSSWNYEGWKGLLYFSDYKSEKDFKKHSLGEYASYPIFSTVGIDASFYNPLSAELLKSYAQQVPETFSWLSKVWERITVPKYAAHPRYGNLAGKDNPHFLDADLFKNAVLSQIKNEEVKTRTGPFVFQFQQMSSSLAARLPGLLSSFFSKLPSDFMYAVEVRNPELLNKEYFQALNQHKVTHCFNHWTHMPSLREQMVSAASAGGLEAEFYVSRLLTPIGVTYQQAVERFSPYQEIKERQQEMREDVVKLFKRTMERQVVCYVIVNNRVEGCSPKTILELSEEI